VSEVESLAAYLDEVGIGAGPVTLEPIGEGHSNLTYRLRRGEACLVLRRPPRGELSPSANDVAREARILAALAGTSVPVPTVHAICEDTEVLGAPFYLAAFVAGEVLGDRLPDGFRRPGEGERIAGALVDGLVEVHAVDLAATGLADTAPPTGYLERQLRRFGTLLEANATRPLPDLERVRDWLESNRPESPATTLVHGDYRLGNVMFAAGPRIAAILDWEMSTIGDPLADLGYLTATWADPDDVPNPLFALSEVTRGDGFPDRAALARAYGERTGRPLEALGWYQVLALWKSAIFLEGSYRRYLAGDSQDPYFAGLDVGVPALARAAVERAAI
jgi:aminoglycoside phosphotransferase (APT) family kinase protein